MGYEPEYMCLGCRVEQLEAVDDLLGRALRRLDGDEGHEVTTQIVATAGTLLREVITSFDADNGGCGDDPVCLPLDGGC